MPSRTILLALVLFLWATGTLLAESDADRLVSEVRLAYTNADFPALAQALAPVVTFDGDAQMVSNSMAKGALRLRDEPPLGSGWVSATIGRDDLVASYVELETRIGRDRLVGVLGQLRWQQLRSDRDGFPYREARSGDLILYAHLTGEAGVQVLDEAVIFVIRVQDGRSFVVAHLADF
jgi:hypothetical protein